MSNTKYFPESFWDNIRYSIFFRISKLESRYFTKLLFFSFLLLLFAACNPLKKLPQGKYFLNQNIVRSDSLKLTKEEINSALKQKPNRKILGVLRLHLGIYYLGNTGDTTVEGHHFLS